MQDHLPDGRLVVIDARTGRWRRPVSPAVLHPYARTRAGVLRHAGWVFTSPGDHLAEYLDHALPGPGRVSHGWTGVREHSVSTSAVCGGTVTLWDPEDIAPAITALAVIDWHGDDITGSDGRPELRVRHRGAALCPEAVLDGAACLWCTQPRGHSGEHFRWS
ncbi:hypothetical protein [Kitasatospora sp. NPDC057223]|uniref:hypothetical protein n=1 Tax=Kitasatospora sp. NPDC057223 TaxID=3346055 RepID=UPI00364359BE